VFDSAQASEEAQYQAGCDPVLRSDHAILGTHDGPDSTKYADKILARHWHIGRLCLTNQTKDEP